MKSAGYISAILLIIAVFGFAIIYVETFILEVYPPQLSGDLKKGQWIKSFQNWASLCVVSAAISSILWFMLAQWGFKIDRWEDTEGKRPIWCLLFLVPIIVVIVSCIFIKQTESSLLLVYCFFLLNGLAPYYISTLLFSPSAFKYIPVGAKVFRSRCFW